MFIRGGVNTFVLVINYLDETWTPRHATIGLFKVHETSSNAMALQLQSLGEKFVLILWVITFVKDEGNNFETVVATLQSIIDYEPFKLLWVYEGTLLWTCDV